MSMDMDMLAAPKKIVDGLTEVFQGFAQMFEGVSEQLALLAATAALALLLLVRTYRQPVIQPLTMELPFSQVQEG